MPSFQKCSFMILQEVGRLALKLVHLWLILKILYLSIWLLTKIYF